MSRTTRMALVAASYLLAGGLGLLFANWFVFVALIPVALVVALGDIWLHERWMRFHGRRWVAKASAALAEVEGDSSDLVARARGGDDDAMRLVQRRMAWRVGWHDPDLMAGIIRGTPDGDPQS